MRGARSPESRTAARTSCRQHVAAGNFVAAQHRALELRDQQSTRSGRQLPEILPQSIDGQGARGHAAHHAFKEQTLP